MHYLFLLNSTLCFMCLSCVVLQSHYHIYFNTLIYPKQNTGRKQGAYKLSAHHISTKPRWCETSSFKYYTYKVVQPKCALWSAAEAEHCTKQWENAIVKKKKKVKYCLKICCTSDELVVLTYLCKDFVLKNRDCFVSQISNGGRQTS